MRVGLEHKGPMFVHHAEHARTTGSAVEPPIDGIVIGILLGLEEDVMVSAGIELEVAWFIGNCYLNTMSDCSQGRGNARSLRSDLRCNILRLWRG